LFTVFSVGCLTFDAIRTPEKTKNRDDDAHHDAGFQSELTEIARGPDGCNTAGWRWPICDLKPAEFARLFQIRHKGFLLRIKRS
jgi:hypothetical protein